jgi:F0F1-type ATP synthase assembly protein I
MPRQDEQNYGQFVSVGLYMAVGVLLGLLVGKWLDARFGWGPWGTAGGAAIGLSAGMYLLIKEAIRMNKD